MAVLLGKFCLYLLNETYYVFDVELDIKVANSYNIIYKTVHPYIYKTKNAGSL